MTDLHNTCYVSPELCTADGLESKASFPRWSAVTAVFLVKALHCSWVLLYPLLFHSLGSDTGSGNKVSGEADILLRPLCFFLLCIYKKCFRHETLTPTLSWPLIIPLVSSCSQTQENSPLFLSLAKDKKWRKMKWKYQPDNACSYYFSFLKLINSGLRRERKTNEVLCESSLCLKVCLCWVDLR